MIDIHTHIIPKIDDGASSMDEAVKMLKVAADDGIHAMVATPHVFSTYGEISNIVGLQDIFYSFKQEIASSGIDVDVYLGAENFFISGLREKLYNYRQLLTINNSDYFLLEFPLDFVFPGSKEFIFDVMLDGMIPIICHPERNQMFQEDLHLFYEFVQAGALSQINAASLTGQFGPSAQTISYKMLHDNLVHVIASDCHDAEMRRPELSFIYQALPDFEEEQISMYVNAIPQAILSNLAIPDIGPPLDPNLNRSHFSFFKREKR